MYTKFKMLIIILLFFNIAYADYTIVEGNSNSKISFNNGGCTSSVSGFFKNVLSKLHYKDGRTYAGILGNQIEFWYQYPSNNGNDGYQIKFYVYDKNENFKTSSDYLTLSNNGGSKILRSSKDYDGEYFTIIEIQDKSDSDKYCRYYNKSSYIKIEKTTIPKLNNVDVTPNSATSGSKFTFKAYLSNSLPSGYEVKVDYGAGYKSMTCSGTTCSKDAYPTQAGTDREYNIKLYDNDANQIGHKGGTYTVTESMKTPTISSLNPTSFTASDGYQNLYINGSNFNSSTKVYIDWGDGWEYQSAGVTYKNSSQIKFNFTTTSSGSGTWKVKVKNGTDYSNYKTFEVNPPLAKPAAPSLQSPSNNAEITGTSQTLDWNNVSGATGYELALRDATLNQWIYGGSKSTKYTSSSQYTVSGLTEGHKYAWTVQAKNSAGLSADSTAYYFTVKKSVVENTAPAKPTISTSSEFTKGEAKTISIQSGDDIDGDKVKISCYAKNSNYLSSSPYNSGLDTPQKSFSISFTFNTVGSQTISCKSIDEQGLSSAYATVSVDVKKSVAKKIIISDYIPKEVSKSSTEETIVVNGSNFTGTTSVYYYNGSTWYIKSLSEQSTSKISFKINPSLSTDSQVGFYLENENGQTDTKMIKVTDTSTETIKLDTLTTDPQNAKVNTQVTFKATLTENLPNELYRVYLNIDGQSTTHEMDCQKKECTFPELIKSAGIDRKFTCTLKKGNKILSTKEGKYTMVDDFSISEVSPKFLDTDNRNHVVTIKGSGFTKSSQIYRKQPTRDWHTVGTTYISNNELRATLTPTEKMKGNWYFYIKNGTKKTNDDKYIVVKQNQAPILNEYNSAGTNDILLGNEVTISLRAYDNDGDIKQIDVNWGDKSKVSSRETSNNAFEDFKHSYSDYGVFYWGSNAYDNEMKPSNRVTGKVVVYDSEYTKTASISKIYSVDGNGYLSASNGQYLVIEGSNLSRVSNIKMIRPDGSTDYIKNDCTFGGSKKCIKYSSSNKIGVNLKFGAGDVGEWQFAVENKDSTSNYQSIEVKKVNVRPYISNFSSSDLVPKIVSGATRTFTVRAIDSNDNLQYIYMIGNGQTVSKSAISGKEVVFSFTAPTVSSKITITLQFQAKDSAGLYSGIVKLPITIFPNTVANKSRINKEEIAKRTSCEERKDSVNGSVSLATGAENFSLPLLKVQGLHTIASIITYNSLLLTDGDLSKGWSHNYGVSASLEFIDENNIRVHWDDGRYNDFVKSSENNYTSTDKNAYYDTLEKTTTGYTLNKHNRMVFKFYANGILKEISNYLNQKILMRFDESAKLISIEDVTSNVKLLYAYNDNGKLAKVIDPQLNREVTFSYDENSQLSSLKSPAGEYYFSYNSLGQITQMQLGDGRQIFKNTYQENGQVATEDDGDPDNQLFEYSFEEFEENGIKKIRTVYKNGLGDSKTFVYDAKDFLLYSIKDSVGNSWTNIYNQTTRALIESNNPKNQKTKYSYDAKGNLLSQTLPNGLLTNYSYDSNNNLLDENITLNDGTTLSTQYVYNVNNTLKSKTLANGETTQYEYNSDNQIIKITSPSNYVTTYTYKKGRLSTVTYPKGNSIVYGYDEAGRLITETNMPINSTVHYSYDNADRVTKVTDAMGNETHTSYNQEGKKLSTTDAKGNITYYSYDGNGNLIKTLYPDNTETTYAYDGEDRVTTITYANGATNKFEYDALGRVTKQIDAMGNFITFKYDALGNVLQKFDTNGNLIAGYKYDAMQHVIEAVDYFNNKVSSSYSQLGLLEQTTDPLERVSRFKYDKLGRLTEAIDALNGISKQGYDAEGNTKDFTDPNQNTTTLKRDKAGNLTQIKTASESTTNYLYNANGLLTKETNGRGQERSYTYRKDGQVKTITDEIGVITYAYDNNGNVISIDESGQKATMVYDEMNRLSSYTDTMGNTIGYTYDSVGNLKTLTYPDGKKVEYGYNLANQLISVKDWNNQTTTYEYDNNGRMVKRVYPNGAELTREYDSGGRLINQKEFLSQFNRVSGYAYEYDKVGNIVKESVYPQISPKALASLQMSYAKGNLLDEANQTKATFDKDDNMLSWDGLALTYDSRNRLIKANGVSYAYDAQNHRISKTVNGKQTTYITNPNASLSQLLIKTDADGNQTYYVYGLGLISQTKADKTLYYHYDLRGSTIALSDTSAYITDKFSYSPYGKLLTHTGSTNTPFLFVGKHGVMKEENELVYMRARYYHERLRRFVNRDTLIGEVGDFGSLNRFGYVNGRSIIGVDPEGKVIFTITAIVLSVAIEIYTAEPVLAPSRENLNELMESSQIDYNRRNTNALIFSAVTGGGSVCKLVAKKVFSTNATRLVGNSSTKALAMPIKASWGGIDKKGMTRIEHIMSKHSYNSTKVASKFSKGTKIKNIKKYVDEALRYGQRGKNGTSIFYDTGKIIGKDVNGMPTSIIAVGIKNQTINTAFPISKLKMMQKLK